MVFAGGVAQARLSRWQCGLTFGDGRLLPPWCCHCCQPQRTNFKSSRIFIAKQALHEIKAFVAKMKSSDLNPWSQNAIFRGFISPEKSTQLWLTKHINIIMESYIVILKHLQAIFIYLLQPKNIGYSYYLTVFNIIERDLECNSCASDFLMELSQSSRNVA